MPYKVVAKKTKQGNYQTEAWCPKGHTSYKKDGDTSNEYTCPAKDCGLTL